MSETPNYGLYVTDDTTTKFKDWRERMSSESDSNMVKIDAALSKKAEQSRSIEITLTAENWTGDAAPFSQQVAVNGLKADSNGSIAIANTATADQRAAVRKAQLSVMAQVDGSLTLNCDGKKPTVDIPAVVVILG